MTETAKLDQEISDLRDRLSRLSEASVRISESLDLDTVLQGILDSARELTEAGYGVIATSDDSGRVEDFIASGMTVRESQHLREKTREEKFCRIPGPRRVRDFASYTRLLGIPEFRPPMEMGSFLAAPIRHQDEWKGNIYLAKKEPGKGFSREDEGILAMFASQAALAIANAHRYREERRTKADLETLIDTSPVGVIVFDARTGVPGSCNREAGRIVNGLRRPDQSTEQLLEVVTFRRADGREISLEEFPLAQALSIGETVRAEEIVIQVPDGRSVTTLINATPIRSEEGEVESVVVTLQDMTALEELDRLRAEFLGMVSHELRVPLTSIRGSASALLDTSSDLDPAEMRQFFQIILQQADSMRELIGDLLDVARIETGTLPVAPEPAEIASLVDRARNTFLSGGGRNPLDIDLPPDLPLVMADKRRIIQVLGNLLSNAAKHSPESSAIRVAAVRENLHIAVSVTDEGRGISPEQMPRLFRKFVAKGGEKEREIGRSGLGLAICKGILEAHGGRIWAESDGPGMGARFTFTIPVVEGGETVPARFSPRSAQEGRAKARILVVDDDPQTLRYVRDALSKANFEPVVSADPDEGLLLMQENKPHLILLDLVLPGTDGIELMGDIHAMADVPVIFLSGYGRDEVIAQAFEKGAADYIVKPFSPTELVARVRAALRRGEVGRVAEPTEPYVLGDLTVDYSERRVTVAGRTLKLTPAEYDLLFELSVNAGRVVPHHQLLRRIWGPMHSGDLRPVRTLVKRLRRKLDEDAANPTYLFAEPRVGYRMPEGQKP